MYSWQYKNLYFLFITILTSCCCSKHLNHYTVCISHHSAACYMLLPPHPPWLYHTKRKIGQNFHSMAFNLLSSRLFGIHACGPQVEILSTSNSTGFWRLAHYKELVGSCICPMSMFTGPVTESSPFWGTQLNWHLPTSKWEQIQFPKRVLFIIEADGQNSETQ